RTRLEIRPLGLADGRLVAIVALRRRHGLGECLGERQLGMLRDEPCSADGERAAQDGATGVVDRHGWLLSGSRSLCWSHFLRKTASHFSGKCSYLLPDCAPLTRTSISSTARLATSSFPASRARSTTLVFGPCCGSKNG